MRVSEWSVELLSDAYSLPRLRPKIEISGNIEQNALQYIFSQKPNKRHVLYQPQHWYNGFKGDGRAETEINEGDMLVHFAGINHDGEGEKKSELMSQWFAKIEQYLYKWQVPLERTKYPKEIADFWKTYKEAKEMMNTVYVRNDTRSGLDQEVTHAKDELKWAIEELAYDTKHLKKCMEYMARVLRAAEYPQVAAHVDLPAYGNDKEGTEPAVGEQNRFSNTQEQLATSTDVKTETDEVSKVLKNFSVG